jgi:dTDP-glucose pyrophosphorylase
MELIVIAAGKGSRFKKAGIFQPKPLVLFHKKPLFWWATESALASGEFNKIHFAVLREHINSYNIDQVIINAYPNASLHIIESVTSGAAETAALIAMKLDSSSPVAFVDCDLAFSVGNRNSFKSLNEGKGYSAALFLFESNNPAFSYAIFNSENEISGTIEKKVASSWAICGIYAFKSAKLYLQYFHEYKKNCNYSELFLSGIVNNIAKSGEKIAPVFLSSHLSLGTPADIQSALKLPNENLPHWVTNRT